MSSDFTKNNLGELKNYLNNESFKFIVLFIHLFSLFIKSTIGLYGYSGEGDSPKFGDYEAQRHWMELTYNLPIKTWYTDSLENPKEYWPLDYPPLSGYYSYIWGYFFSIFMPNSVTHKSSWGFESLNHKLLMRFSVIISDIIFFHLPLHLLLSKFFKKNLENKFNILKFYLYSLLILIAPGLIIIDHGHFQYNCVMHGLFLLSLYFLYGNKFLLTIFTFALCINFKQMGLYFSLPFAFYVVKYLHFDSAKSNSFILKYLKLSFFVIFYGLFTVFVMLLIWSPWIVTNTYKDVLTRIFPLWRGIFEDKVIYILKL